MFCMSINFLNFFYFLQFGNVWESVFTWFIWALTQIWRNRLSKIDLYAQSSYRFTRWNFNEVLKYWFTKSYFAVPKSNKRKMTKLYRIFFIYFKLLTKHSWRVYRFCMLHRILVNKKMYKKFIHACWIFLYLTLW